MKIFSAICSLLTLCVIGSSCYAQHEQAVTPFTHASLIEAEPLDSDRAKTISEFLQRPAKHQNRAALTGGFCKPIVTKPTPAPDHLKLALALVESDIVPVLSLSKEGNTSETTASVSYSVEFDRDHVTLRSSNARYDSQANGLRIAYPHETSSHVWFESKGNGSTLFIIPPVRECSVQFIVACPRTYSDTRALEDSKLAVTGLRYLISAKVEGLFQAPGGEESKVLAGVLGTSRVQLPSSWFSENLSRETPSASVKVEKPINPLASSGALSPVHIPARDAVEARLEFGTSSSVKRIIRSRSTVDVLPFLLETPQRIRVERTELPLNPGSCIVISRRQETHY
jgi:hypothetical protein